MGSQNSSTNSLNKKKSNIKNKKSNQEINQSQIYFNDSSSYKGVKTDTTSLNGNSLSGNSSISDKNNENKYEGRILSQHTVEFDGEYYIEFNGLNNSSNYEQEESIDTDKNHSLIQQENINSYPSSLNN